MIPSSEETQEFALTAEPIEGSGEPLAAESTDAPELAEAVAEHPHL